MESAPWRFEVLDLVPIGLFVLDRDLVIRYWNRTLETWTGLSGAEMVGHPIGEHYPHLLDLQYAGRFEEVFRHGTPAVFSSQLHPYVVPITLPEGRQQRQNVTVTAIRGADNEQGALVAIEDVTELVARVASYRSMRDQALAEVDRRRRGEEEIRQRNLELSVLYRVTTMVTSSAPLGDRLATVIDHLLASFELESGLIDLSGDADRRAPLRVQRGLSDETVEALATLDDPDEGPGGRLPERYCRAGYAAFARTPITAGETVIGTLAVATAREHTFDTRERMLLDSIGREIGAAVQKAALEEQLRDAYEQASLYLDILTHDVNNAIAGISGYADLMTVPAAAASGQDPLIQLRRGIARAAEIIRRVSTIRRIHEMEPSFRPIRLDELVRSEAAGFSGAKIVSEVPPVEVLADELLGEVFTNLIGNSIKFGRGRATIWIHARIGDAAVECSVEDDGPGIPDGLKNRLFERFEQGEQDRSGQGLGLYIVRSLVYRYGGECRIEDRVPGRPEQGTAIRFTIPGVPCGIETPRNKDKEPLKQDSTRRDGSAGGSDVWAAE